MALINRVSRLFRADFNAVLDHIEEPELMLRQSIREMESDIADRERDLSGVRLELKQMQHRQQELGETIASGVEQLDLCFATGKDDLARSLLRRRLEAEKLRKLTGQQIHANEQFLSDARSSIDEDRTTLDGLRQKADLFGARGDRVAPATGASHDWDAECLVSDDDVEIALLREQQARSAS